MRPGTCLSFQRSNSSEEECIMKVKGVFVAAMLLTPTAALAAPGIVTASVGMRAGPGPGFPMVDRIPGGARVNIHGCLRGDAWCDVSWSGDRGWVSSRYLKYLYRDRYVYLPDYVDDVPVVPFVLSSYWGSYYTRRPWYHRHAYWNRYWHSHARFATQMPPGASHVGHAGRIEPRPGFARGAPRPQGFAHVHGPQAVQGRFAGHAPGHWQGQRHLQGPAQGSMQGNMQGRFAHVNGPGRPMPAVQQPIARAHAMPQVSAAPMARPTTPQPMARSPMPHMAQPNAGRVGSPPMAAQAQMGGMRAAPAMPHMGGGAPSAAPRPGLGGPPGGGPGHQRH
jgi:uncharacterized protein YraI